MKQVQWVPKQVCAGFYLVQEDDHFLTSFSLSISIICYKEAFLTSRYATFLTLPLTKQFNIQGICLISYSMTQCTGKPERGETL